MSDLLIPDLVQLQANAAPNAVALVSANQRITYGEMNGRANQLAHHLRSLGVGLDVPIAICMERSIDLPIAALAVLKAGGAYLPLDPSYPSRRLALLLEDSATPIVITHSNLAAKIPQGKWKTVLFDQADRQLYPTTPPSSDAKLENLAYIIFTSGSTGRPKGVQISHSNLINLVNWHRRTFLVTPTDKGVLQASPGFDAAVWEIWPYLAAGASLYVVDDTIRSTPDALRDWIVRNGITICFVPTVIAESLIELPWPQRGAFRFLLTGADTLRHRPQQPLPFSLINNYGPTECSVVATSGKISALNGSNDSNRSDYNYLPSIGRPISNVSVYIVDENLQRVPDGAPGELLIGGRGVGRGYLNSPTLTADKFLPDTFSHDPGARLYRTGDLGRLLPDGEIAFMGRIDDQIKIMGHRIEPNEIAAVLNRHPLIDSSFVCSYAGDAMNQRLVAYVVPTSESTLNSNMLRDFLSEYLPTHMVPATFVKLDHLPLSAHGKLDRSALPQPTPNNLLREASNDDSVESSSAQSAIEAHLTVVLSSLLGVSHVASDDNFFTLGGHSLMGAQLIAKIRENFGVELSLRTLFEEPTPRGMAIEIERLIHARLASMSEDEAQRLLASSGLGI
jgi:amino acid adenylation domain-containing protein